MVTLITCVDDAGSGRKIADALNMYIPTQSYSLVHPPGLIKWGVKLPLLTTYSELQRIVLKSDLVIIKSNEGFDGNNFGRIKIPCKTIQIVNGSKFRRKIRNDPELNFVKEYKADINCYLTEDLYVPGWEYMPHAWNNFNYQFQKAEKFKILHIIGTNINKGESIIRSAVEELGREDVEFVCKKDITQKEIAEIWGNTAVYVEFFKSKVMVNGVMRGGYGNGVIQAMSQDIPTRTFSPQPTITYSVDEISSEVLKKTLQVLLDWDKLEQVSKQQFQAVQEKHSYEVIGKKWFELVKKLI